MFFLLLGMLACKGGGVSIPDTDEPVVGADADSDGYARPEDCDDGNAAVNPAATDLAGDGFDQNCDGVDGTDIDGDGFAAAWSNGDDCDDEDASVVPVDEDGDGAHPCDGDCAEGDANVGPDAAEACDGVDNDCDGTTDEADATDAATWFGDGDGDGYGDAGTTAPGCAPPTGFVEDDSDCDDGDAATHPDADELCDEVDRDCDGDADDGAIDRPIWYGDRDLDGFGDAATGRPSCEALAGTVSDGTDCDDRDGETFPGAVESCDAADEDCDGVVDVDAAGVEACARHETFVQGGGPIDVLYVIDNSCSMGEEQALLIDANPELVQALWPRSGDVHLGVVTTDAGALVMGPDGLRWVDSSSSATDAEAWFATTAAVGVNGSGNEEGRYFAYQALEVFGSTVNTGFRRPNADLAVIVLSDEDDFSRSPSVADFADWLVNDIGAGVNVSFNTIVGESPMPSCATAYAGTDYLAVQSTVGGAVGSICARSYIPILQNIAAYIAPQTMDGVSLAEPADPRSIVVTITEPGGVVVVLAASDWRWDAANNKVVWAAYVPDTGASIDVDYIKVP